MSFYTNLKIRTKLTLGFATVVAIALGIGVFGYLQIHLLSDMDRVLYEKAVKPTEYSGEIRVRYQRLRTNVREYILAQDQGQQAYYKERTQKFQFEMDAWHQKLEKALPDAAAVKLFADVSQGQERYFATVEQVFHLMAGNRSPEALDYIRSDEVFAVERTVNDALADLQQYLVANAERIALQDNATARASGQIMLGLALGASLLAVLMALAITRSIANPLRQVLDAVELQQQGSREKARLAKAIAEGDLNQDVLVSAPLPLEMAAQGANEIAVLLRAIVAMSQVQYALDQAFIGMTRSLRQNRDDQARRDWLKNGQSELNVLLRGEKRTGDLTEQILTFVTEYLGAATGVFYLSNDRENTLEISAGYAVSRRRETISSGEGLAGQAAREGKMIIQQAVPPGYLTISSGLGEADPVNILVLPLLHNGQLVGVLELGSFKLFSERELEFLQQSQEAIAITLSVNQSRQLVNSLLEQTQAQTEELRVQQEELQQTNEELEERAQMLEQQREQIRAKNRQVEEASRDLQLKAEELARVSTYKSEFLANMSHELRTPLNSLMILSGILKENRDGNLSDKQIEYALTINSAGRDLLNLINDILDLSKIEAGHLEFHYEELALADLCRQIQKVFQPISSERGIDFSVELDGAAPKALTCDGQRVQQILKNLLSNACKFTSEGQVKLRVYPLENGQNQEAGALLAFAVSDTGIGIAADKQALIFNAFQQADGSTSRTYGGTGLGLSISRQLAHSMGGDISLCSAPGAGSTFILSLPVTPVTPAVQAARGPQAAVPTPLDPRAAIPAVAVSHPELPPPPLADDRGRIESGRRSILIIEDDLKFARILLNLVRERGFLALIAADGESGLALAERYSPSAVILDVMLPHIDGWGVMRSLKDNPQTRHIPVHFITCLEDRQKALNMGAIGYATKPVSSEQLDTVFSALESAIEKTMKMLLIVEDDPLQARAMVELLANKNVNITLAENGTRALALLKQEVFDCIVLDLGLADMGAFELLEQLKRLDPEHHMPVIIHTGRELTRDEEKRLHHYAESIIIKGAKSPERLLNEVTLFLHLVESSLKPDQQRMIRSALDQEAELAGKKILLVDDDMRNIFSLTSALCEKGMLVIEAENGRLALQRLEEFPDIDLVLMDIMMPEMDGYQAMRAIRQNARFSELPIIALTAKAMKGDREACLMAGASDYIPKPVELDKLFSLLRVWLYAAS
jgi:CheY-like chemotaxis protein/putative methionine-R-sulfoxide reductase with GAF domain